MSSCLYECLKEAGLEKFHNALQDNGFNTAFSLLYIPTSELFKVGINTDSEKQRFLQLIQIIDSFHKVNNQQIAQETSSSPSNQSAASENYKSIDRSNRSKAVNKSYVRSSPSSSITPQRNPQISDSHNSPRNSARKYTPLAESNFNQNSKENRITLPIKTTKMRGPAELSYHDVQPDKGVLEIQRILHGASYNYGLPGKNRQSKENSRYNDNLINYSPQSDNHFSTLASKKITVCVRKRPLLPFELCNNIFDVITTNEQGGGVKGQIVVHELKQKVDLKEFVKQNAFLFDYVFDEHSTNEGLFQGACKPLISFVMTRSHRATCFCYGQTGAGKSHTLLGSPNEPGLFMYAAQDILKQIKSTNSTRGTRLTLWISLYEIYCGKIFDLLNNQKKLLALEDSNKQVHINGLRQIQVTDVNALMQVLQEGLNSRSVGVTATNADSSRSHAILQLVLKDAHNKEYSRFSFIDLAGSERACDALQNSDKQNRLEGAEINQSLLALKECIRSLDQSQAHTPFRQSKLTQVLRDSFIGKSKTCMIANVSPAHGSLDHTMNTLRYASRVKELRKCRAVSVTPKRKRTRDMWSNNRRPQTAAVTRSKPMIVKTPTSRDIQRSLSVNESLDTSDHSVFKGQELSRTPPLLSPSNSDDFEEEPLPTMKPSSVFRKNPLFTPELVQGSSTPLRNMHKHSPHISRNVQQVDTVHRSSVPHSVHASNSNTSQTPSVKNDTVQRISVTHSEQIIKNNVSQVYNSVQSDTLQHSSVTSSAHSVPTAQSITNETVELHSVTESVAIPDTTVQQTLSLTVAQSTDTTANIASTVFDDSPDTSKKSSSPVNSSHGDSPNAVAPNDGSPPAAGFGIPQSKNNTGLPSPKKFLTYLKGRQSLKTKEFKRQLKLERQSQLELRQESETDTNSETTDKTNEDSLPSTSILRPVYDASLEVMQINENKKVKHPPTPPRLPSPKLDSSLPRRSSRLLESDSPSSTGGVSTPTKGHTTPTNTSLKSASEFHDRLMEAFVDDRNAASSNTEISHSSSSNHKHRSKPRRSRTISKKEQIHKAQSEVVIAHQEHISEILRVSIDEERLYHNLRDGWEGDVSFRFYTTELKKLLSTKMASIEALKAQLATYEKIEKSFANETGN